MPTLSIIIPVYNEAATIASVIDKVSETHLDYGIQKEIIVVNDGSKDNTREIIDNYVSAHQAAAIRVLHKEVNEGKGAAIHSGIKLATGDYVIIQDGDLELDPGEFNLLLAPMVKGFADVVYGSRFIGDKPHRVMNFFHSRGNKFLTFISNMFSNMNLTDMETCYKLFKADIIKSIELKEKRFGFEPEVTAKMARIKGIRVYEVGISYYGRTRSDGKKIGWKDLVRAIWCILKYNISKKVIPPIVFTLIGITCLWSIINYRLQNDDWKYCIRGDGYGYYGYLPAIFIIHHFNYNKVVEYEKAIRPGEKAYDLDAGPFGFIDNNMRFSKCYVGIAVLLTPFFLLAYFLSFLFHQDILGGYSIIFQESVAIASVFYMMLGLIFIRKLLKEYKIPEPVILISLLFVLFGTNLYYYTIMQPSMSHQYSFGIMAMFLYHTRKAITDARLKNMIWMTVAIALLALIRPTNAICVAAIPFLAGNVENFKKFRIAVFRPKTLLLLLGIAAGLYSIQCFVWYFETGHFYIWSYVGESFDFAHPHFFDILFSYRKGLFVYTPLIFVAMVCGAIYLARQNIFGFAGFILFFLAVTYLLSSWVCWFYGGSYGLRAYIDFFPVFITGMAFGLTYAIKRWIKWGLILAGVFCTYLNLVQTYQFNHFILPFDGTTKAMYWKIFMKTDINEIPGLIPFPDSTKISFYPGMEFPNNFEGNNGPFWQRNNNITNATSRSGKLSGFVCTDSSYSSAFVMPVNQLPHDSGQGAYITVWAKAMKRNNNVGIVVGVETKDGHNYFWTIRSVMNYVEDIDQWQEAGFMTPLPQFKSPDDRIVIYVLGDKGLTYLDDFNVRFGKLKP